MYWTLERALTAQMLLLGRATTSGGGEEGEEGEGTRTNPGLQRTESGGECSRPHKTPGFSLAAVLTTHKSKSFDYRVRAT